MRFSRVPALASLFLAFFVLESGLAQAQEPARPPGALPGLMSPVMELEFGARMRGKDFSLMGKVLSENSGELLKIGRPQMPEPWANLKVVAGKPEDPATWRFEGWQPNLDTTHQHLHFLSERILKEEKLTAEQSQAVLAWIGKFDRVEAAFRQEPSLERLNAITSELFGVFVVFFKFDRPEVRLLEAILEASTLGQKVNRVGTYFFQVGEAYEAKTPGFEKLRLDADGITFDPEKYLKDPQARVLEGLEQGYQPWLKGILLILRPLLDQNTPLLKAHRKEVLHAFFLGANLLQEFPKGQRDLLIRIQDFTDEVQALLYMEDALAPVALRFAADQLFALEKNALDKVFRSAQVGLAEGAGLMTVRVGKLEVTGVLGDPLEITFKSGVEEFSRRLSLTLRLAEATLAQARTMAAADRDKFLPIVEALKASEKALNQKTPYGQWLEWVHEVEKIPSFYQF